MDFKPSWSKTGNKLVFFRRLKDDPVTVNWITAIGIINVDGTGFHELTDGTHTDFNPTWTRDGLNTPIWNRKNPATGSFFVMQSKVGQSPGQEVAISAESYHTWAFSCLIDGRILVSCAHPTQGWGYFLMTRQAGGPPQYERIDCELAKNGLLDRVSVSPSETKLCFEFQTGFEYKDPGRTLYIADFDAKKRAITNVKAIANQGGKPIWYAYPRWIEGEAAVVYHSYETGKGQLYVYRLKDRTTERVSTNADADYRYPHGEAAPC
jgi:Tol biopolymer transport system component